jgi:hypothetical protein
MWKFPDGVRSGTPYGHRFEAMGDGHKTHTGNNRAVPRQPTGASGENDGRQLRCHICRDVIGIYEPMITLLDGPRMKPHKPLNPMAPHERPSATTGPAISASDLSPPRVSAKRAASVGSQEEPDHALSTVLNYQER